MPRFGFLLVPDFSLIALGASIARDAVRHLVIRRRQPAGRTSVAIELASAADSPLPAWDPGSHIELVLPADEGDLVRQYSLCGKPCDADVWRIVVHREAHGRGGSAWLCDNANVGRRLRARGPHNHFPFVPSPRMTLHASGDQGRFDLASWTKSLGAADAVFACGPLRLLDDLEVLHERGSPWRLHIERFENPDVTARNGNAFEVVLDRSGRSVRVGTGESILDVLLREGFDIDCTCREGVCGTCEQRILQGVPDHRDAVLTAEERRQGTHMMICVSRSSTPSITLDL